MSACMLSGNQFSPLIIPAISPKVMPCTTGMGAIPTKDVYFSEIQNRAGNNVSVGIGTVQYNERNVVTSTSFHQVIHRRQVCIKTPIPRLVCQRRQYPVLAYTRPAGMRVFPYTDTNGNARSFIHMVIKTPAGVCVSSKNRVQVQKSYERLYHAIQDGLPDEYHLWLPYGL